MKKKNFLYLAALGLAAAACSSEDDSALNGNVPAPGAKMITETITASNGDNKAATRAAVDADAKFSWSEGDQIAVHVSDGNYYTTDALAAGGNLEAEFTVSYPAGSSRDAFAVFPASIVATNATNYGQSGASLDVTLPASYTLAQVSGTTTPCPMIATNTGDSWVFSQLCGMLRLTLNCIPGSTSYLTIDFNGKKVQGNFAIASPVTPDVSTIATSATTGTDDIITITGFNLTGWTDGMVLNLPLPTGDYTDVTVTAYNSSDEAVITFTRPLKASGTYTAQRAKGRKVTASAPVFSISSGTRVFFAPGNLQATTEDLGEHWTWSFAENQYDYIGASSINGKMTSTDGIVSENGTLDLFRRSVEGNSYGISQPTGGGTFKDWGTLEIGTYPVNYWQTPTESQWLYVVNSRTAHATVNEVTNARCARAKVNGINGLILFPDFYEGPTANVGEDIIWGTGINLTSSGWNTICTVAGWTVLEKAGCVFLPAAGRLTSFYELTEVGESGRYWINDATRGRQIKFTSSASPGRYNDSFHTSVRLVHVIN